MYKIIVLTLVALVALATAYPSTYGYGGYKPYGGYEETYDSYHAPRFGTGYDKYIYGKYEGHKGPYDYYGKSYKDQHSYGGYEHKTGYYYKPYSYGYDYKY